MKPQRGFPGALPYGNCKIYMSPQHVLIPTSHTNQSDASYINRLEQSESRALYIRQITTVQVYLAPPKCQKTDIISDVTSTITQATCTAGFEVHDLHVLYCFSNNVNHCLASHCKRVNFEHTAKYSAMVLAALQLNEWICFVPDPHYHQWRIHGGGGVATPPFKLAMNNLIINNEELLQSKDG